MLRSNLLRLGAVIGAGAAIAIVLTQVYPDALKTADADWRWLDNTYEKSALAWVAEQNDKTVRVLRQDPRFATFTGQAELILTDPTRLPEGEEIDGAIYNYWQDRERPLGVWRRASLDSYYGGQPRWETMIDLDRLSAAEGRKWIFAGANCRKQRCLIRLSENGKDAVETREFDLESKSFAADGFRIPLSKTGTWWYDDDTLLVAPALDGASVNKAGYPNSLRLWRRGAAQPEAKKLFEIGDWDAMLGASFVRAENLDGLVAVRGINFEQSQYFYVKPDGTRTRLPLPEQTEFAGSHKGKLLLRLNQDWAPAGSDARFKSGELVSISLAALLRDHQIQDARLVYRPAPNEAVTAARSIGKRIYLELLRDYRSAIVELSPGGEAWTARTLPLETDRFITIAGVNDGELLLRIEGLLSPEELVLFDPADSRHRTLYRRAPQFDASKFVAELRHTNSRDGTDIAYTLIRPKNMARNGQNPTLVYGYGGYDVSVTPRYEPLFGKLWLEPGGVYVHAYLRGGGERGPEWHKGAMRTNRQQPYDDMTAILEDLHRQKVSSPEHTGILGRSNGGLMVAVMLNQKPELMNAAIVGGPLTDMLNFHELPPGSSWTAEYGDPRDPKARAFLATYSPLQQLERDAKYPVPLVITSTDDDRVLPGHARRYAARMQELGHEALYFEDKQGGHYWELAGGPAPGDWRLRSTARAVEYTYLWRQLGRAPWAKPAAQR